MTRYDALIEHFDKLSGTAREKLDAINAQTVPAPPMPAIVPAWELYECLDLAEFPGALEATQLALVRDLLSLDQVDLSSGSKARARLALIFGNASGPTRLAIGALAARFESRVQPWWSAPVADGGGGLMSPVSEHDLVAAGLST